MKSSLDLLTVAFDLSLMVTVFAYGLRARREDLRFMWHQPRLLLLSLIGLFVLTPAVALVVVETFAIPLVAQVGIVALSLSIIPPMLPQKEEAAGGDRSYAIGLTVMSAGLAIVVIPFQVHFLGDLTRRPYGIPGAEVAGVVLVLIAVPLALAMLVRRIWPAAPRIGEPLTKVAGYVTLVALAIVLVAVFPAVWDLVGVTTIAAMVAFNVGAVAVGHLMGGPERARSIVLAISCASRHPSIAFTIATINYPGRNVAGAVVLCLAINGVVTTAYTRWQQRQQLVADA